MQVQRDFPTDSGSPKHTSKKRNIAATSSFGNPKYFEWRRKVPATKSKPPSSERVKKAPFPNSENRGGFKIKENNNNAENLKVKPRSNVGFFREKMEQNPLVRDEDNEERTRVWGIIKMFRAKCREISLKKGVNSEYCGHRIDFKAREELTKQGKLRVCTSNKIGPIAGVNVGDKFKYRVELIIVGIHSRIQHGIDYMMYKGKILATCVVAKEGYDDKMGDSEVITYVGEGGFSGNKEAGFCKDQKLVHGNLALKNSMNAKNDVRVVRGVLYGGGIYVYDGLYRVVSYEEKRGPCKNLVFEFKLRRCPGQPAVNWRRFKND